jgi:hypothetical protein
VSSSARVLGIVTWHVRGKRNTYQHIINQDDIARNHPAHWLDNSYLLVAVNPELIMAHCHGQALTKTLKETRRPSPIERPALIRIESYEHTCLKLAVLLQKIKKRNCPNTLQERRPTTINHMVSAPHRPLHPGRLPICMSLALQLPNLKCRLKNF